MTAAENFTQSHAAVTFSLFCQQTAFTGGVPQTFAIVIHFAKGDRNAAQLLRGQAFIAAARVYGNAPAFKIPAQVLIINGQFHTGGGA